MLGSASPTNGDSSASQTFTGRGGGTLSFWYNVTCPDTVQFDRATCDLERQHREHHDHGARFRARHHAGHAPDPQVPGHQQRRINACAGNLDRSRQRLTFGSIPARPCPPGIEGSDPGTTPRAANPHEPVNLRSCTRPMRSQRQRMQHRARWYPRRRITRTRTGLAALQVTWSNHARSSAFL
jgi:hypothetical protein